MASDQVKHRSQEDLIKQKHPNIKQADLEDLLVINQSLQSLLDKGTITRDPYILSIPQDEEFAYNHRSRQHERRQFALHAPFSHDEPEELQYQTYSYYTPGTSLFMQVPSTEHRSEPRAESKSAVGAPKKKITLGAYKQRKDSSMPEKLKPLAEKTQAEKDSADILASLTSMDEPAQGTLNGPKRKREVEVEQQNKRVRSDTASSKAPSLNGSSQHEVKSSQDKQREQNDFNRTQSSTEERDLPMKLSPLRESMPRRLSPTLHPAVEAALAKKDKKSHERLNDTVKHDHGTKEKTRAATDKDRHRSESPPRKLVKLSVKGLRATDTPAKEKPNGAGLKPVRTPTHTDPTERSTPSVQKSIRDNVDPPTPSIRKDAEPKTELQRAWANEQKRLEDRGRELKHSASAAQPGQPELAAIRALSSFMSYLLAFTCADQGQALLKPWRSLGPFFKFVLRLCEPFPALAGIAWMLQYSACSHMTELIAQKATDTPTQSSLIAIIADLRNAAHEIAKHDFRQFQNAYRVAQKDGMVREVLQPGVLLQGDYMLPTDLLTTPVQAVRAALAMLEEWIQEKSLDVKIDLEPA